MANLADGTTWIEADPGPTDPRSEGEQEIRAVRVGIRKRAEKEHETYAAALAGGEHKEGSAKVYRQDAAPTDRPNGDTLTAADDGRIWVDSDDSDKMYVWDGSTLAWLAIATGAASLVVTFDADITTAATDGVGYTNATGQPVQVSWALSNGGAFAVQADFDDAMGFRNIAVVNAFQSNIFSSFGSVIIPNGGKFKTSLATSGVGQLATTQLLTVS